MTASGGPAPSPLEGAAPPAATRGRCASLSRRHLRGHGPGRPQRSRAAPAAPRPQGPTRALGPSRRRRPPLTIDTSSWGRVPSGQCASGPASGSVAASNPGPRPGSHGGRPARRGAARACCGAHSDPGTTSLRAPSPAVKMALSRVCWTRAALWGSAVTPGPFVTRTLQLGRSGPAWRAPR